MDIGSEVSNLLDMPRDVGVVEKSRIALQVIAKDAEVRKVSKLHGYVIRLKLPCCHIAQIAGVCGGLIAGLLSFLPFGITEGDEYHLRRRMVAIRPNVIIAQHVASLGVVLGFEYVCNTEIASVESCPCHCSCAAVGIFLGINIGHRYTMEYRHAQVAHGYLSYLAFL